MKRLLALILLLPLGPVVPPPGPPPESYADSRAAALPAYGRLLARHVREGVIDGKQAQVVDYAAEILNETARSIVP